jgi:transcriptional regulator with XRE-family HTH domain
MSLRLSRAAIDRACQLRGLTYGQLAQEAGLNPATLSLAMNGRSVAPGTLRKLAEALERIPVLDRAEELLEVATG